MFTFPINMMSSVDGFAFASEKSVDFATNEWLNAGDVSDINLATALSVSCWVKRDTTAGTQFWFSKYTSATSRFHIAVVGSSMYINVSTGGTARYGLLTAPAIGEWHHYCVVFDGAGATDADRLKMYIDGVDTAMAFTGAMPTQLDDWTGQDFTIGQQAGAGFLDGKIDDFGIFNTALSVSEVVELFSSREPQDLNSHSKSANLKHWWLMGDGPGDDTAGVGIVDQAGSNDAAPTNMDAGNIIADPAIVPFTTSLSVLFDGTNEYVDVGSDASLRFERTEAFSVSSWFKTTDAGVEPFMGNLDAGSSFRGWAAYLNSGKITFYLGNNSSSNVVRVITNDTFNDGAWKHVLITYDGSSSASGVKIYVNGILRATTINANTLSATTVPAVSMRLGKYSTGTGDYFTGNLDEISVWSSQLTQSDVTEVFNGGAPEDIALMAAAGTLVSWWRMGEGDTFPTLLDHIGPSDGTMTNMEAGDITADPAVVVFESELSATFNGVDEYVQTAVNFSGATALTISGWFYRATSAQRIDISQTDNANSDRVKLLLHSSGTLAYAVINGAIVTSGALGSGWFHLALVYDGTLAVANRLKLYVDGLPVGSVSGTPPTSIPTIGDSQTLRIGQDNGTSTHANGNLDEVAVWSVALSASEITELYNSGATFDLATHSVVPANYWKMGEGDSATTVFDQVGSADGTLVNMDSSNYVSNVP